MKKMKTKYQVVENGIAQYKGDLMQCWIFIANVYGGETTLKEMQKREIYIEPVRGK